MQQFGESRKRMQASLDRLSTMAELLGPALTAQKSRLSQCIRFLAADQAQFGVIGAEGVGKSTLINAILGEYSDIVPTERSQPGTVAATYISFGEQDEPQYRVVTDDEGTECILKNLSKKEFGKYALQKFNKNNEKMVKWLEIEINNGTLAGGLTLVDIPGGEGVSTEVREQTSFFLSHREHAIAGVTRERSGYGALKRLLGSADIFDQVGVLIYNTNRSAFDDVEDGLERDRIEEYRQGFVEAVAGELSEHVLKKTFVTNLRRLSSGERATNEIDSALDLEGQAALAQIAQVIEQRSVTVVLKRGVALTIQAVDEFQTMVRRRKAVLDALLSGETGGADVVRARGTLNDERRLAVHAWTAAENDPEQFERDREAAKEVTSAAVTLRGDIARGLGALKDDWEARENYDNEALEILGSSIEATFSKHAAEYTNFCVKRLLQEARPRIVRRQALLNRVLSKIDFFDDLPTQSENDIDFSASSAPGIEIDRGVDVAAAAGFAGSMASASVSMGVTGIGLSVAWIPAVASVVAGLYSGIRHLIRGGDRGAGHKILESALGKSLLELPDPDGEATRWQEALGEAVAAQLKLFEAQLDEIDAIFTDPGQARDRLEDMTTELSSRLTEISAERSAILRLSPAD